jgi:hypothetical protein
MSEISESARRAVRALKAAGFTDADFDQLALGAHAGEALQWIRSTKQVGSGSWFPAPFEEVFTPEAFADLGYTPLLYTRTINVLRHLSSSENGALPLRTIGDVYALDWQTIMRAPGAGQKVYMAISGILRVKCGLVNPGWKQF